MMNHRELKEHKFIPEKGYQWMRAFPAGFRLPTQCADVHFPRLPLHIQVMYSTESVDGYHKLEHQLMH